MTDYAQDIQKYTQNVDENVISGIVKHLGIALRSKNSSLVSCTNPVELERVRESFLKKKLGIICQLQEMGQHHFQVKLPV